jgi:acyl CoA:acetate/3-ketoacid CoA transferase
LIRCAIGSHWSFVPALGALAHDGRIEAYCLPLGVVSHLYRETAAGRPGLITRVGLGTFVDPRVEGAGMNAASTRKVNVRVDFLSAGRILAGAALSDLGAQMFRLQSSAGEQLATKRRTPRAAY